MKNFGAVERRGSAFLEVGVGLTLTLLYVLMGLLNVVSHIAVSTTENLAYKFNHV